MNQIQPLEKKHLLASCPNCRGSQLYSLKSKESVLGFLNKGELLVCRTCRNAIFVKELKKMLMSV